MGKICAHEDIELSEWEKTYYQPADDSTDFDQHIVVKQEDAGAGPYWIIRSDHWAVNDLDELIEILEHAGIERRKAEVE